MTEAAFTPGPWQVNCSHIYTPDGAIIAQVHNPGSKASDYPLVANRDLMAAAPDLYEAAEAALSLLISARGSSGKGPTHAEAALKLALAKARGDQ